MQAEHAVAEKVSRFNPNFENKAHSKLSVAFESTKNEQIHGRRS